MYATIRRYEGLMRKDDQTMQAVRRLAAGLSQAPGFVSFVVLETGSEVLASVSIFEDKDSLANADHMVRELVAKHVVSLLPEHSLPITGEVVFQRGL